MSFLAGYFKFDRPNCFCWTTHISSLWCVSLCVFHFFFGCILCYSFGQYKKMREAIDKYEGGLDLFSRGYEKMGFTRRYYPFAVSGDWCPCFICFYIGAPILPLTWFFTTSVIINYSIIDLKWREKIKRESSKQIR